MSLQGLCSKSAWRPWERFLAVSVPGGSNNHQWAADYHSWDPFKGFPDIGSQISTLPFRLGDTCSAKHMTKIIIKCSCEKIAQLDYLTTFISLAKRLKWFSFEKCFKAWLSLKYKILLYSKFTFKVLCHQWTKNWHLRFKTPLCQFLLLINLSVQQRCVSEHVPIEDLLEHQVGSQVCHGS